MARNTHSSDTIRCFDKKTITVKFTSDSYINMVDWEKCDFDAPPHLQDITSKAVGSNERVVLPQGSLSVSLARCGENYQRRFCSLWPSYGHDSRHGDAMQMKISRLDLPTIETKADFLN